MYPQWFNSSSIAEESLSASMEEDVAISYEVIAGGTIKGKDKLVDTAGYAYNIKVSLTITHPKKVQIAIRSLF